MTHRRCRLCGADVVWASTVGGGMACFDATPVPEGKFVATGGQPEMRYDPTAYGDGYEPHEKTCPKADASRGKQEFDLLA